MSLIKCSECGHDVSTKAETCPHCGAPQEKQSASKQSDSPEILTPPSEKYVDLEAGAVPEKKDVAGTQSDYMAPPPSGVFIDPEKKGIGYVILFLVVMVVAFMSTRYYQLHNPTIDIDAELDAFDSETPNVVSPTDKVIYMERFATEYAYLEKFDINKWTDTKDTIILCATLFSTWGEVIDASKQFQLTSEETKLLDEFKRKAVAIQVASFPKLRDAYGPVARNLLWESDMSARTIGSGFRIIEFVGTAFAANLNIKTWQTEMREVLFLLRFTQSRYKWYKGADEFTFYDMKPPKDEDLVELTGGTSFRVIE